MPRFKVGDVVRPLPFAKRAFHRTTSPVYRITKIRWSGTWHIYELYEVNRHIRTIHSVEAIDMAYEIADVYDAL